MVTDGLLFSSICPSPSLRWYRSGVPVGAMRRSARETVDAVVVLSSDIRPDSSIDADAVDRLLAGLALVKAGAAPRLITTRVEVEFDGHVAKSDADQLRHVVSRESRPHGPWLTASEPRATKRFALVNDCYPRARARSRSSPLQYTRAAPAGVFEAVGFRVYCVPRASMRLAPGIRNRRLRITASREYLYERLGMVKYRWKGWLPAHSPAAR